MPRILFARLKAKEQEQIAAGSIKMAGSVGTVLASTTAPNSDSGCHTTITSKCIDDPEEDPPDKPEHSLSSSITGYSINPTAY